MNADSLNEDRYAKVGPCSYRSSASEATDRTSAVAVAEPSHSMGRTPSHLPNCLMYELPVTSVFVRLP